MNRFHNEGLGLTLVLLILVFPLFANATDNDPAPHFIKEISTPGIGDYFTKLKGRNFVLASEQQGDEVPPTFDISGRHAKPGEVLKRKSPTKAFLLSAVIPGSGQFYVGSKIKAGIFLAVEAATWGGYISFTGQGDDKTTEFEAWADNHWARQRYEDFLFDIFGVRDDDLVLDEWGNPIFTHHLPDTKTQQYYEMIGKYDQFVFGWDDVDPGLPRDTANLNLAISQNRVLYEEMRHDANKLYDKATASIIVMMANHLISGFEAAMSAKRHNRNVALYGQRFSVKAVTAKLDNDYFPMLTMAYKF
jgi:hypothetical protein